MFGGTMRVRLCAEADPDSRWWLLPGTCPEEAAALLARDDADEVDDEDEEDDDEDEDEEDGDEEEEAEEDRALEEVRGQPVPAAPRRRRVPA